MNYVFISMIEDWVRAWLRISETVENCQIEEEYVVQIEIGPRYIRHRKWNTSRCNCHFPKLGISCNFWIRLAIIFIQAEQRIIIRCVQEWIIHVVYVYTRTIKPALINGLNGKNLQSFSLPKWKGVKYGRGLLVREISNQRSLSNRNSS